MTKALTLSEKMAELEHKALGVFASLNIDIQSLELADGNVGLIRDILDSVRNYKYIELIEILRFVFAGNRLAGRRSGLIETLDTILTVADSSIRKAELDGNRVLRNQLFINITQLSTSLGLTFSEGFYHPIYEYPVDLYLKELDHDLMI